MIRIQAEGTCLPSVHANDDMDDAGLGATDATDDPGELERELESFLRCTGTYTPEFNDEELEALDEGRPRLSRSKSILGIEAEIGAEVLSTESSDEYRDILSEVVERV